MPKIAAVILLLSATLTAQGQAPQVVPFRGAADLVSIYATVTDREGRLVPDLTKDDFVVSDNGKSQPVTLFSNDIQPITIVVMLDFSGSMSENFAMVSEGASAFIDKLLAADRARMGSFAREIRMEPSTFTSDQTVLRDAVDHRLRQTGPSPIWTAVDKSITALLHESGRRVVLVFTDGRNAPERGQIVTDLKDIVRRAQIDDVMVYTIGFSSDDTTFAFARPRNAPTYGGTHVTVDHKVDPPDPALKKLAHDSGGGYFEMDQAHPIAATFARVADELHHQYWLGFKPPRLDGKVHKLEVKVRRPDVEVRSRNTYVAEATPIGGHRP